MKKISVLSIILLILLILFIFSPQALACSMDLSSSAETVSAGETAEFLLEYEATHRRCVLPLSETQVLVTGGEVVEQGEWTSDDTLSFTVLFTDPGEGEVKILRDCPKEGPQTVSKTVTVLPASNETVLPSETDDEPIMSGHGNLPSGEDNGNAPETENALPEVPEPPAEEKAVPVSENEEFFRLGLEGPGGDPLGFGLWAGFLVAGTAGFLLRKTSLRKPLLFLSVIFLGFFLGGCPCAVGNIFKFAATGVLTVTLAAVILITLVWGRVFCGWICPLGGVQELLYSEKTKFRMPKKIDKALKYLKWFVLIWFTVKAVRFGTYSFGEVEPFKFLFNFGGTKIAGIILVLVLISSVFISRPFCRYLCPLGALLTLVNRFAPNKVRLDNKCIGCSRCTDVCPMDAIEIDRENGKAIIDNECIACRKCQETCPMRKNEKS